jgi:hypothetical protein
MNAMPKSIILPAAALALAGCLTSRTKEPPQDKPLSASQQQAWIARAKAPQQFGFSIYEAEGGIAYSGQARLHPNHFTSTEMLEEGVPVIGMRGRSSRNRLNALIDPSSPDSWMEFSAADEFGAFCMGINNYVIPYRGEFNTGRISAFAGVVTQMRIDNLFIENMPFYIRMARGSLGPLARGIHRPAVDAVIGYDNLRIFEYIQFDMPENKIRFSATMLYMPIEGMQIKTAKIVDAPEHGLAVEGELDGQPTPIVLDPACDYHLARGDVKVTSTSRIRAGGLEFEDVPTLLLPVHVAPPRIGRKLLEPYIITICNRQGKVYFERVPDTEGESVEH